MIDKRAEQIWKFHHGELDSVERGEVERSIAQDELFAEASREVGGLHQLLKNTYPSDEQWLTHMTERILDEMERDEARGQKRSRGWGLAATAAAVLLFGILTVSQPGATGSLHWDKPVVSSLQFRTVEAGSLNFSESALFSWDRLYQAEVNRLFEEQGGAAGWTLGLTYEESDEGLSVMVTATPKSGAAVRTWNFYAADLKDLQKQRKGWAEKVVRGIIASDP